VALRYSALVNGLTDLYLGHLDVLTGFDEVKMAVAYKLDGREIVDFPSDQGRLCRCEPIYRTFAGWSEDVSAIRDYGKLPDTARRFVEAVEKHVEVPITTVSVGRRRDQTLFREA
jgi:adenylosuccinate synthase